MNNQPEKKISLYSNECLLLNMTAVPYIGIYDFNYHLMLPQSILYKNTFESNFNFFPQNLQKNLLSLKNLKIPFEFIMTNIDGSPIYSKFQDTHSKHLIRLNLVLHPYIFYNLTELTKDHKTHVNVSAYRKSPLDQFYPVQEDDKLPFDAENILDFSCLREVILHASDDGNLALSPNNIAFLTSLHNSVSTLYVVCVVNYKDKPCKVLINQ